MNLKNIRNEPMAIGGLIIYLLTNYGDDIVRDTSAMFISYGVNVTPQAETLVDTLLGLLIVVGGILITRQFTVPAHKFYELQKSQFRQPTPPGD